jgi:hypothetical protein
MMPVGPATRIYLAAGATDLRNHSECLIIPSSLNGMDRYRSNPLPFAISNSE